MSSAERTLPKQTFITNPSTQRRVHILPLFKLLHETNEKDEAVLGFAVLVEKILQCTEDLNCDLTEHSGNDIADTNVRLLKIARPFLTTNVLP